MTARRVDRGLGLLGSLALLLSIAPSAMAMECSVDYPNTFGINLGHSHSSVQVLGQGAIRIPIDYQSFTATQPSPTVVPELFQSGEESSLQGALFNVSRKVCRDNEPQYYITRTFETPLPDPDFEVSGSSGFSRTLPLMLHQMRDVAEGWFGETPQFAVVTVPQAWFNDDTEQVIKDAGEAIGLEVIRIVSAPHAAALGHQPEPEFVEQGKLLVYELGRGHFEATVLDVDSGSIERLSSSQSTLLGQEIGSRLERDAQGDAQATLDRFFSHTISRIKTVLGEANLAAQDISNVILTGEHAGHQRVREALGAFLDPDSTRTVAYHTLDCTDDAVAFGTAYEALLLSGETCVEASYLPAIMDRALGVGVLGGVTTQLIRRFSAVPVEMTYNFTTTLDNQSVAVIPVVRGGFVSTARNDLMGRLRLTGIPPAPRGEPTITVRIQLDEDALGDIVLSSHAGVVDADGREIVSDGLIRDNWFRFEDPDIEDVIEEERADDVHDYKVCTNPVREFQPNAVVRRDYDSLDQFWTTKFAAREHEEGNLARALCLYEKSLPYFPIGHAGIAGEIRGLRRKFETENDDTAVLGADNPFMTPSRTGC